jgi:hypothetical protein
VNARTLAGSFAALALGASAACSSVGASSTGGGGQGGGDASPPPAPACSGARAPASFATFKVADAASSGAYPSIQIGPDGAPIVVFVAGDAGQEHMMAARVDDAGSAVHLTPFSQANPIWTPARVAATRDGRLSGMYVTVADQIGYGRYVTWTGRDADAANDIQPIADPTGTARPAIVMGADDRPIMAVIYGDESLRLLSLAADGSWSRETVELAVDPFEATLLDMALDSAGQPVLLAGKSPVTGLAGGDTPLLPSPYGLTVWRRSGGKWTQDRLLASVFGVEGRIRRSPSGDVSVFYAPLARLARGVLRGEDWTFDDPIADAGGQVLTGWPIDVAFGPGGEIEALVQDDAGALVYGVFDGCTWSETSVASTGNAGAIAIDGAGRAYVAYEHQVSGVGLDTGVPSIEVWYARSQ